MTKPKVLLLGEIEQAHDEWHALADLAELTTTTATSRPVFLAELAAGKHDGVVVICDRAPHSLEVTGKINPELISAFPASLKFICHNGAGYDSIDVAACTARGIRVSNTPSAVNDSTADTALFLILAALRGFNNGLLAIRNGTWLSKVPPPPLGHDPQGKVLGILGMGGIGRNLLPKAEAVGMRVIYHNRARLDPRLEGSAAYVASLDDFLARSDVVSIHIPLSSATRNFIGAAEIAKMKPGVVIVNTARGGVLDEDALVAGLASGHVLSVGLDVYQQEPNIHPGLLANPHVCLLPHMGTSTVETKQKMEELNLGNIRAVLERGRLNNIVPEQASLL